MDGVISPAERRTGPNDAVGAAHLLPARQAPTARHGRAIVVVRVR